MRKGNKIVLYSVMSLFVLPLLLSTTAGAYDPAPGDSDKPPVVISTDTIVTEVATIHKEQMDEIEKTPFQTEPEKLQAQELENKKPLKAMAPVNVVHGVDSSFIIFGYQQSDADYDYHYIWPGLTHVGASFLYVDNSGNFTNLSGWTGRSSRLKAGGAAEANGTKVIMVIAIMSAAGQYAVLTSATNRQNLVNNVVSAVTADSYCQGVSFDFEPFVSNSTLRDGITAFTRSLSTTLKAIKPSYELSYYVDAYYDANEIDLDNIMPYLDYINYSAYDWGTGPTVHAMTDVNTFIPAVNAYLNAGCPPSKFVLALAIYGRDWSFRTTYNQSGADTTKSSKGWTDGYYNTTLLPRYGGPLNSNYVTGDEVGWYTYNSGVEHAAVWNEPQSMEYQVRLAKNWQDSGDVNNGIKLRGVAYWSLMWTAMGSSYDPISKSVVAKTRLYPQFFQICEEILYPPGVRNYLMEKFEGPDTQKDYRWRIPSESPDSKGYSVASIMQTTSPSGTGQPPYSDNAMRLSFAFASTSGNKLFFRHEILNDETDTTVTDVNHARFYVNQNSIIRTYVYAAGAYTGRQIRMVAMDTARQLEMSSPFSIANAGWQKMEWDMTDPTQVNAYTTAEPAFKNGNGVLNASTTGEKDIGFIGYIVEGGSIGSGTCYFDEVSYSPTNPGGKNYVINEFRYNNINQEYVEIYGPAGAFPAGMQLRFFNKTNGSVSSTINLTGTIPNDGGGYGYWVIGDSGVANVDQTFSPSAVQNIPNTQPGAMQLFNNTSGNVYDSVVYQAWGGLGDLIRRQTLGVTNNGYPWIGAVSSGANNSGQTYTIGRYPDGKNTFINGNDFSAMPSTPGAVNGNSVSVGTTIDFSTIPTRAFQTYNTFTVYNPVSASLPASPSGGNAYRCVDTTGGGVMAMIGDASLGANSTGYLVSGEIYIPGLSADTNAIAIGICGRQGSNFFTSTKTALDNSGYESGYWLIYENRAGVNLNDGLTDHATTFKFVYAHNDNVDTTMVTLLASVNISSTGVATSGAWSSFNFTINPGSNLLEARINNVVIYSGAIPAGGPISGGFQVGFRENHTGAPGAKEGTWIDNLVFSAPPVPVEISNFSIEN